MSQAGRANKPCGDAVQVAAIFCPEGVTASPAFLPLQISKACGGGGQVGADCGELAGEAANAAVVNPANKMLIANCFMVLPSLCQYGALSGVHYNLLK